MTKKYQLTQERFEMKRVVLVLGLVVLFSVIGCVPSEQRANEGVVTAPVKETVTVFGPAIEVDETEIDLGDIGADAQEVVGSIFFMNDGDKPLEIRKVHGPCACFAGYSGDKLLKPGEGGEIQVKFDKNKIPAGQVKRVVNIETNDPANEKVKVHFSFNVERSKDAEELRVLRSNLTAIRKDVHSLRSDMAKVLAELKSMKGSGTKNVATSPCGGCSKCGKKQQATAAKPKPKADTTVYDIAIGDSPVLGSKDASVTIVEFADFQCPYCIREYPKIKEVLGEYKDKVRFVFKHRPLSFHKKAKAVHAVTELAKQRAGEDAFWTVHDKIIANPKKLEISDLREYAGAVDLDMGEFDKLVGDKQAMDALLKGDLAEASKCKARGTPTVFINGMRLADRSVAGYKARIDAILKKPAVAKATKEIAKAPAPCH